MSAAEDLLAPGSTEKPTGGLPDISAAVVAGASVATGVPRLSDIQIASARESWIKLGHSPEAFDAAMAGTPPDPARSRDAGGRFAKTANDAPKPQLITDQARQMVEKLRSVGVSEEKISEALKADGLDLSGGKTPEQAELDRAFDIEHAPTDFRIDYIPHGGRDLPPEQLASFNSSATQWLSALGLPPTLGAALIERCMSVGKSLTAMSEGDRQLFKINQRIDAERQAGGPEQLMAAISRAATAIKRAGPSEFTEALSKSGALNDAWVLTTLANHGARIEAWAKSRPK